MQVGGEDEVARELEPADRVWVGGGYDMEPAWLRGRQGFWGTLVRFQPGGNPGCPAALVRTDDEVTFEEVAGRNLVLELRYVGAKWHDRAVVHVELCDFEVPDARPQDRRQGKWVESHALISLHPPLDAG